MGNQNVEHHLADHGILSEKDGAVTGKLDRKYVHSKKCVCGLELVERALLGESKGIDDVEVKYCSYVPTNVDQMPMLFLTSLMQSSDTAARSHSPNRM